MRKKLLTLATAFGLTVPMIAATDMCVIKKNGEIVKFSVDDVEEVIYQKHTDSSEENPNFGIAIDSEETFQSNEGVTYYATNPIKNFSFKILETSGSLQNKNQVVVFEIDGNTYELSDAGASYLMWTEEYGFETVGKKVADANAKDVVMVLAMANSTADYTLTSPTVNTTLLYNGASETLFSTSPKDSEEPKDPIVQEWNTNEEIQVVKEGKYHASNPNKSFYFSVTEIAGSLIEKNQYVVVKIDGYEYVLSDAGASYLMWTEENGFETVSKKVADANAKDVVMVLACANSTADFTIVSPTHNTTLYKCGASVTTFGVDTREQDIQNIVDDQKLGEIQVVPGGEYAALNPAKAFTFKVMSVEGSYTTRDQVVIVSIDGEEYILSDAGNSYLLWTGTYFVTANTATAKTNAKNIVMMLACANSKANYTMTSPTVNYTMNEFGAQETMFGRIEDKVGSNNDEDKQPVAEATTSITAKAGDVYLISNSKLGLKDVPMVIEKVDGTTVTLTVSEFGSVTIGSGNADRSYAIIDYDGIVRAASMSNAMESPSNILFICKSGSILASGTLAANSRINSDAGETTFVKR